MSVGPDRWHRVRRAAQDHRPRPVVRSCEVRPRLGPGYEVTIEGSGLIRPGVFLDARVGDEPVTDVRVSRDGRITGRLAGPPGSPQLVVTIGSDEIRARATRHARPAPPELPALPRRVTRWLNEARHWLHRSTPGGETGTRP